MVIIYNKSDYLTKVSDIESEQWCRTGVANPRPAGRMRPRKEFLRPNLELKLINFSIFLVFFTVFVKIWHKKPIFLEIFTNAAQIPIWVGHPWCRIKYWQFNKQASWRAIIFRQIFMFLENLETFSENFNFLID
jgi:hypothetical protein